MRKISALLFREDTGAKDENMGVVGSYGVTWDSAPDIFERENFVDEKTFKDLLEVTTKLNKALTKALPYMDCEQQPDCTEQFQALVDSSSMLQLLTILETQK